MTQGRDADSQKGRDLWQAYINSGGTIKALRDLDQDYLEAVYQYGYSQFHSGLLADALKVFRYLALLDHRDSRYFLGIGLVLHKLSHNAAAIPALSYAERLDKTDPRPSICMTECFIQLKNRASAKKSLAEAVKRIKGNKGWELEKKQARQLKHYLIDQSGRR